MNAASRPLQGFWPFFSKELSEWWKGRGVLATVVVMSALGALGTLATRIDALAGGVPTPGELDPTNNILGSQFEQWIVYASIFASIGLLINERTSGTLAWTLSKPVSRSSLLVAKWAAATLMLTTFGLVVPLAVNTAIATWAYGGIPDLAAVAKLGLWMAAVPAFVVAFNLALATRVQSQGAIAAIGFAMALTPYIASTLSPVAAELWPTSMAQMATFVAAGGAPNLPTVAAWALALVLVGGVGLLRFSREDL
jgi:ABC-type transport system involved in multi-copper enzyme maturation permease subunit